MKKRKAVAVFLVSSFLFFGVSLHSKAQTIPFGGQVIATLPCTCPATLGSLMIIMAPFFGGALGVSALPTGAVVYVPFVSQLFAWYNIGVPGTWHLGSYVPGTGNLACWIINPVGFVPPCIPMPFPILGTIFMVGTSKNF